MKEGKRQVATSVAVDDDDVATFKKLQDHGVKLEIQRTPTTAKEDVSKLFS
jgi:PTS system N-acetylgalactosamine-specific IIB component